VGVEALSDGELARIQTALSAVVEAIAPVSVSIAHAADLLPVYEVCRDRMFRLSGEEARREAAVSGG